MASSEVSCIRCLVGHLLKLLLIESDQLPGLRGSSLHRVELPLHSFELATVYEGSNHGEKDQENSSNGGRSGSKILPLLNVLFLQPFPEFARQLSYVFVGLALLVVAGFSMLVLPFAIHTNRPKLALQSLGTALLCLAGFTVCIFSALSQ